MQVGLCVLGENFLSSILEIFFSEKKVSVVHVSPDQLCEYDLCVVAADDLKQLSHFNLGFRASLKILIMNKIEDDDFIRVVNSREYFRVFKAQNKDVYLEGIDDSLKACLEVRNQAELHRQINLKNRELENLNSELQRLVAERTYHLEMSHVDQQEKLDRMRGIVRFIQDVNAALSIEDTLSVIKKDLKKFHGIREPILLLSRNVFFQEFFWLEKNNFLFKKSQKILSPKREADFLDSFENLKLANFFGRPVGRLFSIPLFLKKSEDRASENFFLILESARSDFDLTSIVESLDGKVQALGISLHKILLEDEMSLYSSRWEKTFDGIQDAIAIVSSQYETLRSNKQFSHAKSSRNCYDLFARSDKPCEGCPIAKSRNTGLVETGQIQVGERFFEVRTYPMKTGRSGKINSFVNHYRDITERKDLYGQVLQNEKMSAVGRLAGHIAHELNNPLTGIRSLAQVIRNEVEDSQKIQDLVEIERAAARCQGIIRNLIDFTKEGEKASVDVCLDEIVVKTLPFLKVPLRYHNLTLDLSTENLLVRVEPTLLSQVIYNLVNNACQAMTEKGFIKLQTRVVAKGIEFSCNDSGSGISSEVMSRLFKPFFTTKKDGQGTGLGLSMSKSIIERFGGKIGVNSSLGRGANFWFILPVSGGSREVFNHRR